MGTKTLEMYNLYSMILTCEKRIPKHGDENYRVCLLYCSSNTVTSEKRIPKHGDENNHLKCFLVVAEYNP